MTMPLSLASLRSLGFEAALARIERFLAERYVDQDCCGFRPGRRQYDALDALAVGITNEG